MDVTIVEEKLLEIGYYVSQALLSNCEEKKIHFYNGAGFVIIFTENQTISDYVPSDKTQHEYTPVKYSRSKPVT